MEPLTAITAALTSLKTATEITKLLKDSDFSLEKAELKLKFAELMDAFSDAKIQIADIKEDVRKKEEIIRNLELEIEGRDRESFVYERPFYWRINDDKRDGPFCQKCYDSSTKKIRLQEEEEESDNWRCLECGRFYKGPGYNPPDYDRPVERAF